MRDAAIVHEQPPQAAKEPGKCDGENSNDKEL